MHFVDVESYSFVLKDITREFLKGGWVQSYLRIALSRRVKCIIVKALAFVPIRFTRPIHCTSLVEFQGVSLCIITLFQIITNPKYNIRYREINLFIFKISISYFVCLAVYWNNLTIIIKYFREH